MMAILSYYIDGSGVPEVRFIGDMDTAINVAQAILEAADHGMSVKVWSVDPTTGEADLVVQSSHILPEGRGT